MQHTMRSAFKRWLVLHNEENRVAHYIRIPNWFRWYVRKNKDWKYTVNYGEIDYHCNICELDYEQRRRYKGYYTFDISDEELMKKRGGNGKPKRILDPDLTYMMDLDTELPRFIDLCYPEYVKAGIADSRGKEYIPEANAKDLMYEAEKQYR